MQSQIWNVKHKKLSSDAKGIWVSNVDVGGFNQSEEQISLCARFSLHK